MKTYRARKSRKQTRNRRRRYRNKKLTGGEPTSDIPKQTEDEKISNILAEAVDDLGYDSLIISSV